MLTIHDPFKKPSNVFDLTTTWIGKSVTYALAVKAFEKSGPWGLVVSFGFVGLKLFDMLISKAKDNLEERRNQGADDANVLNEQIKTIESTQSLFRYIVHGTAIVGGLFAFYTNPKGLAANQVVNYFGDFMLNSVYSRLPAQAQQYRLIKEVFALVHVLKLELGREVYKACMKDKQGKIHPTEKEKENLAKLKKAQEQYEAYRSKTLKEMAKKLINYVWFESSLSEGETIVLQVDSGKLEDLKKELILHGFEAEICTKHEIKQKWEGGSSHSTFWKKIKTDGKPSCAVSNDKQFLLIKLGQKQKEYATYYSRYLANWFLSVIDNGKKIKLSKLWGKEQIEFAAPQLKDLWEKVKDLYIHVSEDWKYISNALAAIRNYLGYYSFCGSNRNYHKKPWFHNYLQKATDRINYLQQEIIAKDEAMEYAHNMAASLLVAINSWQLFHVELTLPHVNHPAMPAAVAQLPMALLPANNVPVPAAVAPPLMALPQAQAAIPPLYNVPNPNVFFAVGRRNLGDNFDIALQVAGNGGGRREQIAAQNMNRPRL